MTIKYWPSQQGIELNHQISNLFKKVYLKFNSNLSNTTGNLLSIDILNGYIKKELFKIILLELEILVLDIIEIDIKLEHVESLNQKILIDLINKSLLSFHLLVNDSNQSDVTNEIRLDFLSKRLFAEHHLLLKDLLGYLIFGSFQQQHQLYLLNTSRVPTKHVEILLDNFVIQIADIVFFEIINSKQSLSTLFKFLKVNNLCHSNYISTRSIATFKNNLIWYNLIAYYITYPVIIYNNRYKVWVFTVTGLRCNYIYADRENDLKRLSNSQILLILLLELQDFILPKIQHVFLLIGKLCINLLRYILSYSLKIIFRSILVVTRTQN